MDFNQSAAWKYRDLMNINEISDVIPEACVFKPISGLEIFPPKIIYSKQQNEKEEEGQGPIDLV